jgi:hypothetical protein
LVETALKHEDCGASPHSSIVALTGETLGFVWDNDS